jgi:AcrR family transcriptional regulator
MGSTKEDILRVSLHLFAKDGYEAVSVSQIAGALGMTKGALYRHYQNKRDIFLSIVKRM